MFYLCGKRKIYKTFHTVNIRPLVRYKGNCYTFMEGNSVKDILPSFGKEVYSKRKEFAPSGGKFFSLRVYSFSEGDWCTGEQIFTFAAFVMRKEESLQYYPQSKHSSTSTDTLWWEENRGTGLLTGGGERYGMFVLFLYAVPFPFSLLLSLFISPKCSSSIICFLLFSERWHKMTHKGWCVVRQELK